MERQISTAARFAGDVDTPVGRRTPSPSRHRRSDLAQDTLQGYGICMESLTILVCGATGRLGQLTAVLLEHGHQVRAATRDPHSARARALGELGAQIVRADFDTVESLTSAARSADVVFAAGTAHLAGPQGDIRHGKNIANAAHAAGVGHLVYVSVAGAEQPTGVPVFDSKRMVEEHIRRDRKSTRLNSSHPSISYAVFCLKKKKK